MRHAMKNHETVYTSKTGRFEFVYLGIGDGAISIVDRTLNQATIISLDDLEELMNKIKEAR